MTQDLEMFYKECQSYRNAKEIEDESFCTADILPIPKNYVTMIYGQGGIGKSYLSLYLALNYIKKENKPAFVWNADGLTGETINERCCQIMKGCKDLDKILDNLLIRTEIDTSELDNVLENLKGLLVKGLPIKFIIIDPLIGFFDGENENDNSAARKFISKFTSYAKQEKASIVIVHHKAKGRKTTARGASAFVDAVTACYYVSKVSEQKLKVKLEKDNLGISRRFNKEFYINLLSTPTPERPISNQAKSLIC